MKKYVIMIIGLIILTLSICLITFNVLLSAPGSSNDIIEIDITKGSTYFSITKSLKESNLIKSELVYKIYVKINNPKPLEFGTYKLNKGMGVKGLIEYLAQGSNYNDNVIKLIIPEGKHITDVAKIAAALTNNQEKDLVALWDSNEFIDKVRAKYWFITDTVDKSGIKHPLEGYFFPSTYELLNKDVDGEYIAYKLLDQMNIVLSKYKEAIEASKYSVHELLTLASIVEHEAILDTDRPIIAGVFYNRLNKAMKLQSCATVGYAIDEWKLSYTNKDLAVDSVYNTYYYAGLPIGPGNLPGEASIKAVLYPAETDYLYFLADVCHDGLGENNKVYYSKTLAQHEAYGKKYLGCLR